MWRLLWRNTEEFWRVLENISRRERRRSRNGREGAAGEEKEQEKN